MGGLQQFDAAADGSKGGNVEFEWKVEEGESSGDVFDFKAMEARSTNGCTGDACNGGAAGILFGDGGDGAQDGIATAQLTISGTISDPSAVDGRYSFVFDGNADTSGGHTYFDGKFLTAHDLTREQVYLSDTGFDLV